MKVMNNTLSFSPDGVTSGNTVPQENILFQDFLFFLLNYLNQEDPEVIKNFDLALLQQGKAEAFSLETPFKNLFQIPLGNPGEHSFLVNGFVISDPEKVKVNFLLMDTRAGEEKRVHPEESFNLSLYGFLVLTLLERVISSDPKDLNVAQGNVLNNTDNLSAKGWQPSSLNSENPFIDKGNVFNLKELLKLLKGASKGMEEIFQDLKTFIDSGLAGDSPIRLSEEARVFFHNYLDLLKIRLKEADSQGKMDLANLKEGFSSLPEGTKEEVRNFVQQIKEIVITDKTLSSPQEEAIVQRFILSEQGKSLLLKVKTFGVKGASSFEPRVTDPIPNPAMFYSQGKELNPSVERVFAENRTLPPRLEMADVHRFIKDFTVEIAPSGERKAIVQLEPPELGRMEIKVHVKDGEVEIRAQVEKPETLAQLQQDLSQIKTQLEDLGLRLKDLQISLGLSPEGRNFSNNEERDNSKESNRKEEAGPPPMEGGEPKPSLYHKGRLYRIV